jgi:hypothetical protein
VLCDYVKQRSANRLGSNTTHLPAPTSTNFWRGPTEQSSRYLFRSAAPSLSSVGHRVAVPLPHCSYYGKGLAADGFSDDWLRNAQCSQLVAESCEI